MAPRLMASRTPVKIAALRKMQPAEPKQHRHHKVVADHGAERHSLDDDHSGGRGKAADEGQQCDRLLLLRHRQCEHECIGVDASVGEMQQTGKSDGQHEDVYEQKIERE